jgi:hypothetical protein
MRVVVVFALALSAGCSAVSFPDFREAASSSSGAPQPRPNASSGGPVFPLGACGVEVAPGPRTVRLLTPTEYYNSVRDLLGDVSRPPLAPAAQTLGFDNNADINVVSQGHIEAYFSAAETVANNAVTDRLPMLLPCDPAAVGEQLCGRLAVEQLGKLAFRRTLLSEEAETFVALLEGARAEYGFADAIRLVVTALLQSPQFLYRLEEVPDVPRPVSGVEMASRLSFLLWASGPDEALISDAESGNLDQPAQVEAAVRRMLNDHRAREGLMNFFDQWLEMHRLSGLAKDATTFPEVANNLPDVRVGWARSLRAFIDHVMWEGTGTLKELLTSDVFYVDAALAPLYGVNHVKDGLALVHDPRRAGILGQPAVAAFLANDKQGHPVRRGIFVREQLLCQSLPAPPAGVVVTAPDPDPNATTRERFSEHTRNPMCAGCHLLTDGVGFGMENLDALGRWRDLEANRPVDVSGRFLFTQDPTLDGEFNGLAEMAWKLARSQRVANCVVRQAFRYGMGRGEMPQDACTLEHMNRVFANANGDLRELLVAVATSEGFRYAGWPPAEDAP